jgi:hypothetical protein
VSLKNSLLHLVKTGKPGWGVALSQRLGWPAVVLCAAFLAGFVFCLPDLLIVNNRSFYRRHFPQSAAQWALGGRYTAISPYDDTDANNYAARVNEASRHILPMDPNIKENLSSRRLALTDTLSFMFLGALTRLTGDVSRGWLLARGIAGFLWLLTLYLVLAEASGLKRAALALAAGLTLFADLFSDIYWPLALAPKLGWGVVPPAFRYMLIHALWLMGSYQANFGASRLVSPGLNLPPFFLACYAVWRAVRKQSWPWAMLGGILGGALVYVHPDVWHVYMAAMGLFCAAWSLQSRRLVWPLWASYAVSFCLSIPWLLANYPMSPDILVRMGGVFTHAADPGGLLFLLGIAVCWRWRREPAAVFAACAFAAIFLAMESQVFSGFTVRSERFVFIGLTLGLALLARAAAKNAGESRGWLWLTAALFILAAGRTVSYAAQRYPFQGLPPDLASAFDYLNRETPEDSVVVALGPQETMLLPVYTHDKTLLGPGYTPTSDIPIPEMFERMRRALRLTGVDEPAFFKRLSAPAGSEPGSHIMEGWDSALWTGRVDWQAREWESFFPYYFVEMYPRPEIVQRLQAAQAGAPGLSAEADYLWVGPFERGLMTPKALKKLGSPLYENGTISIYKVSA